MRRLFYFLVVCLSIISDGCIGDYPLSPPIQEPILTVDAWITDRDNDSFIHISWTNPSSQPGVCTNIDDPTQYPYCPENPHDPYLVLIQISLSDDEGNTYYNEIPRHDRKGTIDGLTEDFKGRPGHKYFLDINVTYKGEIQQHHAETIMLPTPAITKVGYTIRKGAIGKEDNFVPLISFEDPQPERNYYLYQTCSIFSQKDSFDPKDAYRASHCITDDRVWPYSVIEDTYLPHEVQNLSIDDGATVAKYAQFYPNVSPYEGTVVLMHSVDYETYQFYKSLLSQFDNEGGAYSATPATPKGNISNGALGLFRATQVSGGVVFPE